MNKRKRRECVYEKERHTDRHGDVERRRETNRFILINRLIESE